jgi:RNA polymerase sigma-70 factor (ECF subfamily)
MIDSDITHSDAKHDNRAGPADGELEAQIPRLMRYARALTRDVVAADDLVQDCLGRALGKSHLWEKGTDLQAWLFTILHNQHVSRVRREARERGSTEEQKRSSLLALAPDQVRRLELRDLERAFAKLPEEQRSVIRLVGLEGMGYEEVASVVNVPVGTVRSRVSRGRETLRKMTGLFPSRQPRRPSTTLRKSANVPTACHRYRHSREKRESRGERGGLRPGCPLSRA